MGVARYQYKIVPIPDRCDNAERGTESADPSRMGLESEMNKLAAEGWKSVPSQQAATETSGQLRFRDRKQTKLMFRRMSEAEPKQAQGKIDTGRKKRSQAKWQTESSGTTLAPH